MDPMTGDDPIRELTAAEQIALRTARAALDSAITDPDPEAREAAWSQFLQVGSVYADTRDSVHLPDDAGEYADGLRAIMQRIPEGWGRWISCGPGWYPMLVELDSVLAQLDPEYEVRQVKEKFGGLCYYAHTGRPELREAFRAAIREAEDRSAVTCELCGEPGSLHQTGLSPARWVKTLCPACAARGHRGRTYYPSAGL